MPDPPTYLSTLNAHPRDQYITFEEGPHIYTVHGESGYTSVTTWNHSHFGHFDADAIADKLIKNKTKMEDPTYKYYGKTREQMKAEWAQNGLIASTAGTAMHYDIECFYNNLPVENESVEFQYFKKFVEDFPDLKAYRTEWMVYYEEFKLSGSIDMVFENPDGTLSIYDWKRVKAISYESEYNKYSHTPCISHLPDTNFWHYSLQLNMYKLILERKYGKTIKSLCLVCLHPDNCYRTYELVDVPVLTKEMDALLEVRKRQIEQLE